MILAADVGVGIVGLEGMQASLAADFSTTQFSHILPLLLWHGRNAYKRSARLSQFVIHRGEGNKHGRNGDRKTTRRKRRKQKKEKKRKKWRSADAREPDLPPPRAFFFLSPFSRSDHFHHSGRVQRPLLLRSGANLQWMAHGWLTHGTATAIVRRGAA